MANDKSKQKIWAKKHYEANKEKILLKCKEYVEANKEKTKAYKAEWAKLHREEIKAKQKKWYEDHKDKSVKKREYKKDSPEIAKRMQDEQKARLVKYRLVNKEIIKAKQNRKYRETHPLVIKTKQSKEDEKIKRKEHYLKNKNIILQRNREYYKTNKEKCKGMQNEWKVKNKQYIAEYRKKIYLETKHIVSEKQKTNRPKINERKNKRYNTDILYKLECIMRARLHSALNGTQKESRTMDMVGCSAEYLKKHIEAMFTDGMTWGNYGFYGWHIDHIIPCASFDPTDKEQQKKCFHYTNLQPLWAKDNLSKKDRLDWKKETT